MTIFWVSSFSFLERDQILNSIKLLSTLGIDYNTLDVDTPFSSQRSEGSCDSDVQEPSNIDLVENDSDDSKRPRNESSEVENIVDTDVITDNVQIETEPSGIRTEESAENNIALDTLNRVEVILREWKRYNVCPECNEKVGNGNLSRHIKEHHENRQFTCPLCAKTFKRKDILKKHVCKK